MALNPRNQIEVSGTVAEALKLTWALWLPYVILTLVFSLPMAAASGLGLFDHLVEFTRQAKDNPAGMSLGQFPLGEFLLTLGLGFVVLSSFGIFWYRYLLLGPQYALKCGFAELNSMIWRFSGYGLLVMGVGFVVFSVATLLGCVLGTLVCRLIGQSGTAISYLIQIAFVTLAYVWPLNFAARTALIFPAIAVGRPLALRQAWAESKDAAGGVIWSLLIVGAPLMLVSWGMHFGLSAMMGIEHLTESGFSAEGYWWIDILLSPIGNLGLAAMLGVVAIAYRDLLNRAHAPEMVADAHLAR